MEKEPLTRTRVPMLALGRIGEEWSFYYISGDFGDDSPSRVGPVYKTKLEALADLDRYACASWGWDTGE